MSRLVLPAPAKLNLHLGIHAGRDERGYHRADSLMVALDVGDEVLVSELPDAQAPVVACEPPVDVPQEKNTAYRAAVALGNRVGRVPGVRIDLRKGVPDQAGMGGSSSDAASVLKALCELWGVDAEDARVIEAAREVGADVPFFLDPVPTLLGGAGDVPVEKFPHFRTPVSVVLVRPKGPGVSTVAAYAAFDEEHEEAGDPEPLCALLRTGEVSPDALAGLLANNLDPVACRLLPAVGEVRTWLLQQPDVLGGQVTGSGSCVFGVCKDDVDAARVADAAQVRFGGWSRAAHIA